MATKHIGEQVGTFEDVTLPESGHPYVWDVNPDTPARDVALATGGRLMELGDEIAAESDGGERADLRELLAAARDEFGVRGSESIDAAAVDGVERSRRTSDDADNMPLHDAFGLHPPAAPKWWTEQQESAYSDLIADECYDDAAALLVEIAYYAAAEIGRNQRRSDGA